MESFVVKERNRRILKNVMKKFNLNLSGLTVFTESATGNYLYTPIIASLAGAKHVFAVTSDSKYGLKEEVRKQTLEEAHEFGVREKITVLFNKEGCIRNSDIITNSGFVRPITKKMISYMKPTAVIPLMRLGNEFRPDELDLQACYEKGIIVLGTNENHPKLNLLASSGFKICKILFEKGFSVFGDRLLLIGSGDVCNYPTDFFINNKIPVDRVTFDDDIPEKQKQFVRSREQVLKSLGSYDVLIINEIRYNVDILSNKGFIPVKLLKKRNPSIQIVHLAGSINKKEILEEGGLALCPKDIRPFGYMSISSDYLGLRCTSLLIAASLKVAEVAVRCRLKGMSIRETIEYSLKNSPAMLVTGGEHNTADK
jgi:hypothetical protein